MTWECPECHSDNTDDRDMCEYCGAIRLAGAAPTPPAPVDRVSTPQQCPIAAAASPVVPQPVSLPVPAPISQPSSNVSASMPQVTSQPIPTLTLVDPSMGEQLRLTGTTMLGRNTFSTMASNFAISRQHASVHYEQGVWWVTDEGSNNGTSIMRGGQILDVARGISQPIRTGDLLLIPAVAGGYAQLRLAVSVEEAPAAQAAQPQQAVMPRQAMAPQSAAQAVPAPAAAAPAADPAAGVEGWFVECPECGRLHLVAGERSKVTDGCDECGCSLARTSAVYRTLEPGEDYTDVR